MSTVPDKDNKAPDPKEVQAPKAGDSQVAKVEDKAHQAGLHEAQGADALKIIQKQAENTATAHVPGLTIVDNGKAVKPGEKSEGVKSYVNAALAISTEAVSAVINEAEKGIKALGKAVGIGGDAEGEGKRQMSQRQNQGINLMLPIRLLQPTPETKRRQLGLTKSLLMAVRLPSVVPLPEMVASTVTP